MRAIVIERPNDIALRDLETPSPGPGFPAQWDPKLGIHVT